jgi:hypothetical protein
MVFVFGKISAGSRATFNSGVYQKQDMVQQYDWHLTYPTAWLRGYGTDEKGKELYSVVDVTMRRT